MASSTTARTPSEPIEVGARYVKRGVRRPKLVAMEPAPGDNVWWFVDPIEHKWYAYRPHEVRRVKR